MRYFKEGVVYVYNIVCLFNLFIQQKFAGAKIIHIQPMYDTLKRVVWYFEEGSMIL